MQESGSDRFWNVTTHAAGSVLALFGFYFILDRAEDQPLGVQLLCWAFCLAFFLLYSASTRYHLARTPESTSLWNAIDRAAIFFTIAVSCTALLFVVPKLAAVDRVIYGWSATWLGLGTIWSAAVLGSLREIYLRKTLEKLSMVLYAVQGLGAAVAIDYLSFFGLGPLLVLAGVVCYLIGFFRFFRYEHLPHYHPYWHLCVLAGSVLHYAALWLSV